MMTCNRKNPVTVMSESTPKVVFLGTHGQHNIGDELLLETFLRQLGAGPDYVINTYDRAFTQRQLAGRYRFELIDTAGDRLGLIRHLRSADAVVFGGGSIVKELPETTGRGRYATLLMILAVVTFTRWVVRKPIAMLNIGVGPIKTRIGRLMARAIIGQAQLVTVRDQASFALCREIGVGQAVRCATDAVFSVESRWLLGGESQRRARAEAEPLRIGLNLNFDIENPDNWEHFQKSLATTLRALGLHRRVELHGLPMQSVGKARDDASILAEFAARVPELTFVEHRPTTHTEMAQLIDSCHLVISERLHAIVMAAILGVPAFALAYDVKVRELAEMLGLDGLVVDVNAPLDPVAMTRRIESLLADLDHAGRRLQRRADALSRRARADLAASRAWVMEQAA